MTANLAPKGEEIERRMKDGESLDRYLERESHRYDLGRYAATTQMHYFHGHHDTCIDCFGFRDDNRHL
jgi:hypothetical protein